MNSKLKSELEQLSGWKVPEHDVLEWLLRELPPALKVQSDWIYLYLMPGHSEGGVWLAGYRRMWPVRLSPFADHSKNKEYLLNRIEPEGIPENALCQLAIQLFKTGILKKEV